MALHSPKAASSLSDESRGSKVDKASHLFGDQLRHVDFSISLPPCNMRNEVLGIDIALQAGPLGFKAFESRTCSLIKGNDSRCCLP